MTLAKHNYHTAAPIPAHLTPDDVIHALHDHNTCLSLQALTIGHTRLPTSDPEVLRDTFWYPPDVHPVETYSVTEMITYMPYFSWGRYNLTFSACFQNTPNGLKTRADAAAGVVLRAEFRVIRGDTVDGEVDGEGQGLGDVEFVLVEDVEVQCSWYMMPFVRGKMEQAHRDICRKVVEKVVMEKTQADIARVVEQERGKARAGTPRSGTPSLSQPGTPIRIHSPPVKRESFKKRDSTGTWRDSRTSNSSRTSNGSAKRDSGAKPDSPLKLDSMADELASPAASTDTSHGVEMATESEHAPVQPKSPEILEEIAEKSEEIADHKKTEEIVDHKKAEDIVEKAEEPVEQRKVEDAVKEEDAVEQKKEEEAPHKIPLPETVTSP